MSFAVPVNSQCIAVRLNLCRYAVALDSLNSLTSHGSFIDRYVGLGNAAAAPEVQTEEPEGAGVAEGMEKDMVNSCKTDGVMGRIGRFAECLILEKQKR